MEKDDIIQTLKEDNKRLRKLICSQEPHRIKVKLLVPFGRFDQLDDLINQVEAIRTNHYDVEIEVVCKTEKLKSTSGGGQAVY